MLKDDGNFCILNSIKKEENKKNLTAELSLNHRGQGRSKAMAREAVA